MSKISRNKSHLIGRYFLIAELLRRGYEVDVKNLRTGASMHAKTKAGKSFRVRYLSTISTENSWLVGPVEPDNSLYYVLISSEAHHPYDPPKYWILDSDSMHRIRSNIMKGVEDTGQDANILSRHVKVFYNEWNKLPHD